MSNLTNGPLDIKGSLDINLPFFEKKIDETIIEEDYPEKVIKKVIVIGALSVGLASLTLSLGSTLAGFTIAGMGIVGLGLGLSMGSGSFALPFLTLGGIALKITAVGLTTLLLQRIFLAAGVGSLLLARHINTQKFTKKHW